MPEQGKVRDNSGESSIRYRRANRSICSRFGARDSQNHLKAGSLRSVTLDSWP